MIIPKVLALCCLGFAIGIIGENSYEDEQLAERQYCENVKAGVWGAYDESIKCEKGERQMLDMRGLNDDVTEIIARAILGKDQQAKFVAHPNTDNWLELYNDGTILDMNCKIADMRPNFNRFRAEVQSVVSQVLCATQNRERD